MKWIDNLSKWASGLLEDLKQGKDYERLSNELQECQIGQNHLRRQLQDKEKRIQEATDKLEDLQTNIDNVEEELQALKEEPIDVKEAIKEMQTKLEAGPYRYPFKGTSTYYDIRLALRVQNTQIVNEWADKIDERYNTRSPIECVEAVIKYFLYEKKPVYVAERQDVWEPADEFLTKWKGDCDTTAITMHVLIRAILKKNGFQEHCDRLLLHITDTYLEGHANNLWLGDDGYLYTVESTIHPKEKYRRHWKKIPLAYDSFYMKTRGVATPDKSWKGSSALYKQFRGK